MDANAIWKEPSHEWVKNFQSFLLKNSSCNKFWVTPYANEPNSDCTFQATADVRDWQLWNKNNSKESNGTI